MNTTFDANPVRPARRSGSAQYAIYAGQIVIAVLLCLANAFQTSLKQVEFDDGGYHSAAVVWSDAVARVLLFDIASIVALLLFMVPAAGVILSIKRPLARVVWLCVAALFLSLTIYWPPNEHSELAGVVLASLLFIALIIEEVVAFFRWLLRLAGWH